MLPPKHAEEERRLRALHDIGILDSEDEREYDDIVFLAAHICAGPDRRN